MKYTFVPLMILKNSPCPWTRLTFVYFLLGIHATYSRLNNHSHETYGPLQEYKLLALAVKLNAVDSDSTARANIAKDG